MDHLSIIINGKARITNFLKKNYIFRSGPNLKFNYFNSAEYYFVLL